MHTGFCELADVTAGPAQSYKQDQCHICLAWAYGFAGYNCFCLGGCLLLPEYVWAQM